MHLEIHLPLLLDLFLKSTVLLALAALLTAAFRRASAANRHAIAVAALVTLLVLPFTKLARPRWSFALNHAAPAAPLIIKLPPITTAASSETGSGGALAAPGNVPAKAAGIRVNGSAVGVGVWLAGFALALICRAGVGLQLRRLAGESRAMKEGRVLAMARELAAVCGVRAEIRESDTCRVPLAFGVWRPTVLLPSEAMGWSDGRLSAALQHEFGHIRRRDCLTRWFADLACAFYWMNPLVWVGARSLRLAQEQACDDLVLNAGARPDDYATQLVEVVRSLQGDRFTARHALAMAQPSTLETRVRAIVDETRDRSARSARGAFAGFAFATAALALCTAAQLRGADEKKAVPAGDVPLRFGPQVEIEAKFIEITGDDPALPEFLKAGNPQERPALKGVLPGEKADAGLKELAKAKGVDILSSPRVITKSGCRVIVEIIREFRHPTAWGNDAGAWKPTIYDTKNLGVTFDATPTVGADGSIDLQITPELVEFAGFVDLDGDPEKILAKPEAGKPLGERINQAPADFGIPEGHRAQSLFHTRKRYINVTVRSGNTIVVGDFEAASPRDNGKGGGKELQRRLVVLVTTRIAEPDGIPVERKPEKPGAAAPKSAEKESTAVTSNEATFDKKTGKMQATGNVKIETDSAVIAAEKLEIRPKKGGATTEMILPKVEFRDASLQECVEFLVQKSKALDPTGKGLNVVFRNRGGIGQVKITLSLTEIPITAVLRYVAALADCELLQEEFAFVIGPKEIPQTPAPANQPAAAPARTKQEGAALKKAGGIIFPKIDLNEATLSETVDFLRAKAKDLDPDKLGVNLILRRAAGGEEPKITLSLANIPLSEALRYVAALANCEVVAEDAAIIVQPAGKK